MSGLERGWGPRIPPKCVQLETTVSCVERPDCSVAASSAKEELCWWLIVVVVQPTVFRVEGVLLMNAVVQFVPSASSSNLLNFILSIESFQSPLDKYAKLLRSKVSVGEAAFNFIGRERLNVVLRFNLISR